MVNVGETKFVAYDVSGRDAGPLRTAPFVENCEPWHGHTYEPFW
jgi:hypothetical protein